MALDYCVEAMDKLRARGVRFTIRALMSVSSPTAINSTDCCSHKIYPVGWKMYWQDGKPFLQEPSKEESDR